MSLASGRALRLVGASHINCPMAPLDWQGKLELLGPPDARDLSQRRSGG